MHRDVISFDVISPGLAVKVNENGHMAALDFFSTITGGNRKKASQILARIGARQATAELLSTQLVSDGRRHPKKTIGFGNALQMLMILPKRTVSIETRRRVASQLASFYEGRAGAYHCLDEEEQRLFNAVQAVLRQVRTAP